MRPVVVTKTADLSASVRDVWPLLTQTDRANRVLFGNPVTFRAIDEPKSTAARFIGETVQRGFRLVYEELPFEWVHERSFSVERRMRRGPLDKYTLRSTFDPLPNGGTRVSMSLALWPRYAILWPVAWINAKEIASRLMRFAADVDAFLCGRGEDPYREPTSPVDDERLARAVEALHRDGREGDTEIIERLARFLRSAPDADLVRIRPFEVADRWNEDRRAVLRTFLRAVPAGLFELRWGVLCPSCRTASEELSSLSELTAQGHCQLCDLSFDLELDRAVEATFYPHPSLRNVPSHLFCSGGPARTPHVLVQAIVDARASRTLTVPSNPGRYRVFARGGATATLEVDEAGADRVEARLEADTIRPVYLHARPRADLVLHNASEAPRHAKIERLEYASNAATAHVVSTLNEFRSLFSSELLKRTTPLKVARVTVLFSDLTGSTALYSAVGDAAAFRLVDDHFDVLREVVDEANGVFIKTMGDAMMAGFVDTRDAIRAGLESLVRFEAFRKSAKNGHHVGIKLGLYAGPCYVVTANGALDYFGQTVNIASRVQHLASSGELVFPERELEGLGEADRGRIRVLEAFEARVKGVDAPLSLVRVAPAY